MTKRKCVIDETITCEDFQCENCPVKDAYNYGLAEGRKELEKENAELKEINKLYTIQKGTYVEIMNNRGIEIEELKKQIENIKKVNEEILERETEIVTHAQELEKENTKAKELLKTFLLIADNKVSQMGFQLCIADAKQFLNSAVETRD